MSTVATLAALLWGWACSVTCDYHRRVRPAVIALVNHWRAEPDHQVCRCTVQVVFDPRFTSREPVSGVRCQPAYLINFLQVLLVLYIAGIMPPEPLLALDHCSHGLDPVRMLHCFESSILSCFDCRVSGIVTLQGVTAGAD